MSLPGTGPSSRQLLAGSIAVRTLDPRRQGSDHVIPPTAAGSFAPTGPYHGLRHPAIADGLHCGDVHPYMPVGASVSHPAYHRWAPLRQSGPARRAHADHCVTPPITGGLHCGWQKHDQFEDLDAGHPADRRRLHWGSLSRSETVRVWRITPPLTGGLHCGEAIRQLPPKRSLSHPADYRRAPLQHRRFVVRHPRRGPSSRRSLAGSIAVTQRDRLAARSVVIPLSSGGLHCGGCDGTHR
jgi:hypothetical protein